MASKKSKGFQPMLAASEPGKWGTTFPVLASPKIDGVRAIVRGPNLVSRKLIDIPNLYTQKLFGSKALSGLDGELVVGMPNAKGCMQTTMSGVTTIEGEPDVRFFVFDLVDEDRKQPYDIRYTTLKGWVERLANPRIVLVPHHLIENAEQLDVFESACLRLGFEGAMYRSLTGVYKFGRSTSKEGGLVKLKRFAQDEALVIGYSELMHNANEAEEDELGHTKRSTNQENMVPMGTLGALTCLYKGVQFSMGTGFSAEQRAELWAQRDTLAGRTVSFRHFKNAGVKTAPRFPVFVSFRAELDT